MYGCTGLLAFVGDLAVVEIGSSGCGCILLECALVAWGFVGCDVRFVDLVWVVEGEGSEFVFV